MTSGLRVLMYHRIGDPAACWCDPSTISATPAEFARQMRHLAARYRVMAADEVRDALLRQRRLPKKATLLTFDDGCRDFGEIAWPVLSRLKLPVTLFVPTAFPDGGQPAFWWDRIAVAARTAPRPSITVDGLGTLPLDSPSARHASVRAMQRLIKSLPHAAAMALVEQVCSDMGETRREADVLRWSELRSLMSEGVTIGAHTRTHAALTRLSATESRAEIAGSSDDIRRALGVAPTFFSYPFGDVDRRVVSQVADAGFDLAVTCRSGMARLDATNALMLQRINITRRTTRWLFTARLTRAGAAIDRLRNRREDARFARLGPAAALGDTAARGGSPRVAYVMSRFPKLSETFILNEMRALAAHGTPVEVYPLLRERQPVAHPEVGEWMQRAHFEPFMSPRILAAHVRMLRRQPRTYLRTLADVLRGTWGSANFTIGALGTFPKAVRFAVDMQRDRITHVHAHFATHPALVAFVIHRLTGIPYSFTAHGSDLHVDRRMLAEKIHAAAFAVAVSSFNKEIMVREAGEAARGKVHVIHCGVDPGFFKPAAVSRGPHGPIRLVCVASLEEVKGHRFLIEACRLLHGAGIEWQLDLVGDGPLRHRLEREVAAAGLDARVRLLGGQPRAEVARILVQADIAVLASHPTAGGKREGIPVALMEAMSCGLPVVATAISGIPELVDSGVTGLLVPSGDAAALADALRSLAADKALRERLGRAARARIVRDFDLSTSALALRDLIDGRDDRRVTVDVPVLAATGVA